jgi:hypothetical protein
MTMASQINARTFCIPLSSTENVTFQIAEPAISAQGLSLQTWTSSYLLAKLLHTLEDVQIPTITIEKIVPVLELGAGTGLVGLTAAMTWRVPVVLTDLEPIVPGLAHNIALNQTALQSRNDGTYATVTCGSLDWNEPSKLSLYTDGCYDPASANYSKASIVLAADTVYSAEHPRLLTDTICKWLAPDSTSRCIIMYPMRVAYLDQIRHLWLLLEEAGLEAIQEGREQASERDASWDDELLCEWSIWKWNGNQPFARNSETHCEESQT